MIIITILLNIVGIACILISLAIIIKTAKKEEKIYGEIINKYEDIKYYYGAMDNILNNFSEIVNTGLDKVESDNTLEIVGNTNVDNFEHYEYSKKVLLEEQQDVDNNDEVFKRIVELKKQGLASREIAKKLNKGIREVEIVIKMMENN